MSIRIFTSFKDVVMIKSEEVSKYDRDNIKAGDKVYFWYDQLDRVIRQMPFDKFLNEHHALVLKNQPGASKLVICFHGDYFNKVDLHEFSNKIIELGLQRSRNILFIAVDESFKDFAKKHFNETNIPHVECVTLPYMILSTPERNLNIDITKKFSIFSRNYRGERLLLYYNLHKKNLLRYANYSFHYRYPYGTKEEALVPKNRMYGLLQEYMNRQPIDINSIDWSELNTWVDNGPYELPDVYGVSGETEEEKDAANFNNKWSPIVENNIRDSYFNVVVESHYEHTNPGFRYDSKYSYLEFSPTFITEKTYKAIMCQRPFIMYAGAYGLRQLRKMGFKTFAPYINEEYDECRDDIERMRMVADEIERLCNLPDDELKDLFYNHLFPVAIYNQTVLKQYQNQFTAKEWFPEIDEYFRYTANLDNIIQKELYK